jgi:hypothetical protein
VRACLHADWPQELLEHELGAQGCEHIQLLLQAALACNNSKYSNLTTTADVS